MGQWARSMGGVVLLGRLTSIPDIASMTSPDSQYLYQARSTRNNFSPQPSSGLNQGCSGGDSVEAWAVDFVE